MMEFIYRYNVELAWIVYFACAIIPLVVIWFMNKKRIWLAIPITIGISFINFGGMLLHSQTRSFILTLLIPQIIVVTIVSLTIMYLHRKKHFFFTKSAK